MNRKVLGGVVALVVALAAVWLFWLRDRGDADVQRATGSAGSAAVVARPATADKADAVATSRGATPRWSMDVDPEGPLALEGQVVGPDGQGIAGAEVWLTSVPPRSTKSEDDGTFTFDKLVGRTYQLAASRGELLGGPVTYKLTEKSDPVVVRLSEGATIVVTVVDESKQPVDSADVALGDISKRTSRTDARGVATIKPVRPGWVAVRATAAGYAPNTGYATIGSAGATGQIAITLRKGVTVSGRVIDESGKPIPKARVQPTGGSWADWTMETADGEAVAAGVTTDDNGQFTIPALAAGTHTIIAIDGVHAPGRSSVSVSERPVTGVEITMKTGGVLAGVVLDTARKPVPYATVRVAGTGQQMWMVAARQATSDKDGAFELRGLSRAKLQARAESDTSASNLVDIDLTAKAAVRDVKIVLEVAGTISGVVVDEQGAPVTEVQVNAFPDVLGGASVEGLALAGMSSATTDGGGAFTLHGLPDGKYRLSASRASSGDWDWGQQGSEAKTGDKGVRITLPAPGSLTGKVALESGAAPKLATVQVGVQPATPATDGVFTIKELAPGTYDVTFRGPEFAETVKHDIKVETGKPTDLGTVTVMRGRRLTGKVVDGAGRAVAGAKIKLGEMLFNVEGTEDQSDSIESMAGIRSALSDQDGTFSLIGVPKKATSVMADHVDRGRSAAANIAEGSDDPPPLTLTLRGFGSITGKVTQKGEPQGNVTISVSTKGGGAQATFAQTDDAGNFKVAKVPEGTVVLQAMQTKMMAMKSTTVTVQVTAAKDSKVTIDIPVGQIALTIHIKAIANNQVDSAQVFLFSGMVVLGNAKQLTDAFFQGGAQGMKLWLGGTMPMPEFDELVPGEYSVCTIPITGKISEPGFQQRLQEHMNSLKVYCRQVKVTPTPVKQSVVQEVPAMTPLPTPPPPG